MPHTIVPNGWGLGPWGTGAWVSPTLVAGGALPSEAPFDIYCIEEANMPGLLTHPEVSYIGDPTQVFVDVPTDMMVLASGGPYLSDLARIEYNTIVPLTFTLELVLFLDQLPSNFANLQDRHCFVGITDAQGVSIGLFISEIGVLYTSAVHFSGNNIVLDGPTQLLPNSQTLITLGDYYTLRLATSFATGATYIYWTKSTDVPVIGHQLRYVLPAFLSADAVTLPPDRTTFSVRGTLADPTILGLHTTCLGTGLIVPNLLPRADAGPDQAIRTCNIVILDGSRSFDPEGTNLLYKWRLLDAPINSDFIITSVDALTYPLMVPTGFTNKVYSADLAAAHALDPIQPDDVLIIAGTPHLIQATGVDGNGFYVYLELFDVVDSYVIGQPFSLLRQRGISEPLEVKARFLPDKPGLYKFDLVVFDGGLYSSPAITVVNVTESPVPRGLIPDLKFMWDYLSDFWRLVEDRERIEVFWSAMAQVSAAELLTLWQTDYNKSLRDIQRTFQRRWLHFDLLLKEPTEFLELSTVRAVYAGVSSSSIPLAGVAGIAGQHLDLFLPTQTEPVVIYFSGVNPQTAQQITDRINAFMHAIDPSVVARVLPNRAGTAFVVRIDAPYALSVSGTSTVVIFGVSSNAMPQGTAGAVMGSRTYRVERSLSGLDIVEGDFLTVGEGTYRIARTVDDPSDPLLFQRLTLLEDIPLSAGTSWLISGQTHSQGIDFYDALMVTGDVATLEVIDLDTNVLAYVNVPVTGASPSAINTLGIDATTLGQFLVNQERYKVYFFSVTRRQFTPLDPLVMDVPQLQEKIKNSDDKVILRRNIDFFLEEFRGHKCLRFVVSNNVAFDVWEGLVPPERMWAETTYLDNRPTIEENFGIPAEFTLDDLSQLPENVDYLSAVQGLWYSYFSGPTLFNVRSGVQILLGLPFAEVAGIIEEIRNDFSTTSGRLLVRDAKDVEIVRTYSYPAGLDVEVNPATKLPYAVGDSVKQFAPLVKGSDVLDYVSDPEWFSTLLQQGSFHEVEKFFKFLVRVDSKAFNLNALLFVRQFVLRIKPTYTFPFFVVRTTLDESEVSTDDLVLYRGVLSSFAGPYFGPDGRAQMWDQPHPGGGGYWNQLEGDTWGHDQYLLAPEEAIFATLTQIWAGGIPTADGIFYAGMPVFTDKAAAFVQGSFRHLPVAPGKQIGTDELATITGVLNKLVLNYRGVGDGALLTLKLKKNAVTVETKTFTIPAVASNPDAPQWKFQFDITVPVVPSDVLSVFVEHPVSDFNTFVESVGVVVGIGTDWAADTALPADTYYTYLAL